MEGTALAKAPTGKESNMMGDHGEEERGQLVGPEIQHITW